MSNWFFLTFKAIFGYNKYVWLQVYSMPDLCCLALSGLLVANILRVYC